MVKNILLSSKILVRKFVKVECLNIELIYWGDLAHNLPQCGKWGTCVILPHNS